MWATRDTLSDIMSDVLYIVSTWCLTWHRKCPAWTNFTQAAMSRDFQKLLENAVRGPQLLDVLIHVIMMMAALHIVTMTWTDPRRWEFLCLFDIPYADLKLKEGTHLILLTSHQDSMNWILPISCWWLHWVFKVLHTGEHAYKLIFWMQSNWILAPSQVDVRV